MNNFMMNHAGMGPFAMFGASFAIIIVIAIVWSLGWKGTALWYAARNHQRAWYIILLIINTLGILEILYILFWRKNNNGPVSTHTTTTTTVTSKPTAPMPSTDSSSSTSSDQ